MYLEFISAVTDDILSRGHISDRSVDISMPYVDDDLFFLHNWKS